MSSESDTSTCIERIQSKYFREKVPPPVQLHGSSSRKVSRTEASPEALCDTAICVNNPKKKMCVTDECNSVQLASPVSSFLSSITPGLQSHAYKENFFNVPCEMLAQALLGKVLVRLLDTGTVLKGRIVETECYLGEEDKASHSYAGRKTDRNAPMFMKPGTSYVYLTYGMYHCFNISSQGHGAAVLIRALEPLEGLEVMTTLRLRGVKRPLKRETLKPEELCSGPSKLCLAMAIDRETCNKQDLCSWPGLSVHSAEDGEVDHHVVVTKRIGIESAGAEWANKPLRYYLLGNRCVSKKDRSKEAEMSS